MCAKPDRDKKTVEAFFDTLGEERCAAIRLVSADGAEWIGDVVAARCPNAVRCMDPSHVVQWCTDALDEVRREVWNTARKSGMKALATDLKGARFAPHPRQRAGWARGFTGGVRISASPGGP